MGARSREAYKASLERIMSLSKRQLNMADITMAYLLMGYKIEEINDIEHRFTMFNEKTSKIHFLFFDARLKNSFENLCECLKVDVEEYYKNENTGKHSVTVLSSFMTQSNVNPNNLQSTVKGLLSYFVYDKKDSTAILDSLEKIDGLEKDKLSTRIVGLMKDAFSPNADSLETIVNHKINSRATVVENGNNTFVASYNGASAVFTAKDKDEAEVKANARVIEDKMKAYDRNHTIPSPFATSVSGNTGK